MIYDRKLILLVLIFTAAFFAPKKAYAQVYATPVRLTPYINLTATDADSDYLKYKIQLDTVNTFNSGNLQTFDQTVSQTGWSGQNTQTSTAYTSGSTATYTVQTPLSTGTPYYARAYAIDPAGSNTWSNASATVSFNTGLSHATPSGTTSVAGRFGYARSFNGSTDYISLGNNGLGAMSGSFTIEVWVKTTSIAQQTIISEYQSGICQDGRFYIAANSGNLVFDNGNGTVNIGNVPVNDGVWHHAVYVYNSFANRGMTFVDGIPALDATAAGWRNVCASTDTRIGSEVGTAGAVVNGFVGTMDNIRVYSLPISDIKMKQLYYNGFITGCSSGNTGYTVESACPACPHADIYMDDGNCGKRLCAAC